MLAIIIITIISIIATIISIIGNKEIMNVAQDKSTSLCHCHP